MKDTSEQCARADIVVCWETLRNRICQKYIEDRHLVSAAEELRVAINDYFETLGWTANELAEPMHRSVRTNEQVAPSDCSPFSKE